MYIEAFLEFVAKYGKRACQLKSNPKWILAASRRRRMELTVFLPQFELDLRKFRLRWEIDPTSPHRRLSPFLQERVSWVREYLSDSDSLGDTEVALIIDVRGNVSEILKYIEWRVRHEKRARKVGPEKQVRKRFDQFPGYLLAFDLNKSGLKDRDIAEHPNMKKFAKRQSVQMNAKRVAEYRNKARYLMLNVQKNIW
jgi:hypothetical protein